MRRFVFVTAVTGVTLTFSPAVRAECFTHADCRPGEVCQAGRCVSLAEATAASPPAVVTPKAPPGGASSETTTAGATRPPGAKPPVQPGPNAPSKPPAQAAGPPTEELPQYPPGARATEAQAPAPEEEGEEERVMTGLVILPRVAFAPAGEGKLDFEGSCSATGTFSEICDSLAGTESDYADTSLFMVGLEFMGHATPGLRLGLGGFFLPSAKLEPENTGEEFGLGSELDGHVIIEGVIPTQSIFYLPVRAMGGAQVIFPRNELEDARSAQNSLCSDDSVEGAGCSADTGPVLGLNVGAGMGGILAVHRMLRLRGDLLFQYVRTKLTDFEASRQADEASSSISMAGYRVWVSAGLEFGSLQ